MNAELPSEGVLTQTDRPHATLDRRAFALGLTGIGVSACAVPRRELLINLSSVPPARTDDGEAANLATGHDMAGRITAPVVVNGEGPFSFVVDTGANRTVLSVELAERLGLPGAGVAEIHGIAGKEPAPTALVDRLQIDRTHFRRLRTPLLPRARLGVDGLLGVDVLKDRLVTLDFRSGRLRIDPPRSQASLAEDIRGQETSFTLGGQRREGFAVPARYRFGQLVIIGADVSRRPVTAFLDSGSQSTVGNIPLKELVVGQSGRGVLRYGVPLLSATGQTAEGEIAVMRLLKLGGVSITELPTIFARLHVFDLWDLAQTPSLMIGADLMSLFAAIQLDYARRRVIFYPR